MEELYEWLDSIQDYRQPAKVRHKLKDIVVIVLFATLGNAENWEEIEDFAVYYEEYLRQYLELPNGIPSHDTIQRVNTMPALHVGHISERSHDVVFDRRERTKPDRTTCMEVWWADIQRDTVLSKPIPSDANLITLFLKIRVGEWHMEGLRIGYQLYGTVFEFFGSVNRWNNGKCLLIRLAAKYHPQK